MPERAKKLFGVPHVNVQPLWSSCQLGKIKVLSDPHFKARGHASNSLKYYQWEVISQWARVSVFTSIVMPAVHYGLTPDGEINEKAGRTGSKTQAQDYLGVRNSLHQNISVGKYKIADKIGAYFVADISHIGDSLLVCSSPPVPYAHIVMTTTHKT